MGESKPKVIVIGGPNGAGKSTAATRLLTGPMAARSFVNADTIARGLSGFDPESVAIDASRIMLTHLRSLAARRATFAFETTLAARTYAPWLRELCQSGYQFLLAYCWVPSPEFSISRVALRVKAGGHHVPEGTIRSRYYAGVRNFFELYRPLATRWRCYDSSIHGKPRLIASGKGESHERICQGATWKKILQTYSDQSAKHSKTDG